jgi:hypothetical protein
VKEIQTSRTHVRYELEVSCRLGVDEASSLKWRVLDAEGTRWENEGVCRLKVLEEGGRSGQRIVPIVDEL